MVYVGPTPLPAAGIIDSVTVVPLTGIASIDFNPAPSSPYAASNTTPMTQFKARVKDTYGNLITSDNTAQFVASIQSGTGTLLGTLTQTTGAGVATFSDIKYPRAEAITIRVTQVSSGFFLDTPITVNLGPAYKAIATLPGETFTPGVPRSSGHYRYPLAQTAGTFNVTMRVVDDGYNIVTSYGSTVSYTSSDANMPVATATPFVSGVRIFNVTPGQATDNILAPQPTHSITPNTGLAFNIPSSPYTVAALGPTRIVLTLPGETINQGDQTALGKTGAPTGLTAGIPFAIGVYATDLLYNVLAVAPQVTLTANGDPNSTMDGPVTLTNGQGTLNSTYYKYATTHTITPSTNAPGTYTSVPNSTLFTINAKPAVQTIAVLPGQTYTWGLPSQSYAAAVTGAALQQTAGTLPRSPQWTCTSTPYPHS